MGLQIRCPGRKSQKTTPAHHEYEPKWEIPVYMLGMVAKGYALYKSGGIRAVAVRLRERFHRYRNRCKGFPRLARRVAGKKGIEIGGPSAIFGRDGCLPLYRIVGSLDGCNFSENTIWEGMISAGYNYRFGERSGYQYIAEATNLKGVEEGTYDFLLASHCLEDTANPLLAISEWLRVLRPDGCIVFVLPDSRHTFDHRRPVTAFDHLLADFHGAVTEDDLAHFDEILALHDLSMDPPAGDAIAFRKRSLENRQNRCFHHHVFDMDLLRAICRHFKLKILVEEAVRPYHLIVVAEKAPSP